MGISELVGALITFSSISVIVVTVSGFVNLSSWVLELVDVVKAIFDKETGSPILFMIGLSFSILGIITPILSHRFAGLIAGLIFLMCGIAIIIGFSRKKLKPVFVYSLVLMGDITAVILVRTLIFGNSLAGFLVIGSSLIALFISLMGSGIRRNIIPVVLNKPLPKKSILEPIWRELRKQLDIKGGK